MSATVGETFTMFEVDAIFWKIGVAIPARPEAAGTSIRMIAERVTPSDLARLDMAPICANVVEHERTRLSSKTSWDAEVLVK